MEKIIQVLLKLTGHSYLIPFVRGLIHIGRAGKVAFPKELAGQGANLLLSGLNNTMAFQSNLDWIWPWWQEQQQDSKSLGFVPTGMNMVTSNITLRNWISLGVPGSDQEVMVDPVGMLTVGEQGWSAFPYMRLDENFWTPPRFKIGQVSQRLEEGGLPVVQTEYRVDARISWRSEVEVVLLEGSELVLFIHEVENQTNREIRCSLGFSLRPYNTLNISHIHRIKYQDNLWRINHKAAFWLLENPARVTTSDRNGPDPIFLCADDAGPLRRSSGSGIAAGAAEWDLLLRPWERQRVTTVGILRKSRLDPLANLNQPSYDALGQARVQNREIWKAREQNGAQIQIPEERWMIVWNAIRKRLYVFDDGDHFSPGTFLYHKFWIRDSVYLASAHTQLGWHDAVKGKLQLLRRHQTSKGYFCSQEGEWDSNGQAIWMIVDHAIATGDRNVLERYWNALRLGAEWIRNQCQETRVRNSPHFGLMPSGFSAEHFGPNDHYFWDSWWSLQGLLDAESVAAILGREEQRLVIRNTALQLRFDLDKAMRSTFQRLHGQGMPSSPYRKVDSSAIGNLVAVAPLGLVNPEEYWVSSTLEALWQNSVEQGMFFQKIVHTGLNAYLNIQLSRAFLACGDGRWQVLFEALLDHATSVWTWPEAIHPQTRGGCMGDGDHGWAAAEVLSFLMSLLVRVQNGHLLLGHGIPINWYAPDMDIQANNLVTRHGVVSWRLQGQGTTAHLSWNITRNQLQTRVPARFALPASLGFSHPRLSAFVQGRQTLSLTTDAGEFEIPLPRRINESS
ncbi:MAG TPA: hypothetical protein VLM37_06625 [Fibrobacteraceae bacterium]|nr:hypothetical protein [Fibrobacteraceae bacterium]